MRIRSVEHDDAPQIVDIYNHYILNSYANFETEIINDREMGNRISETTESGYPFLLSEDDGEICGYAYAHRFRPRAAYLHSTEISIYLKPDKMGRGFGTQLYRELIPLLKNDKRYHAIIAGISLPNEASVRLHEKLGFEKVAHFKEVGFKFDRWIDVGYWQLIA